MFKIKTEKDKLSSKTKVKTISKYSESKGKERKYSSLYLLKMYKDQLDMFTLYREHQVNTAKMLRFLIDGHAIFEILLRNVDEEFNLIHTDEWSNEDFNQFYDYLKKFKKFTEALGGDNHD